MITAEEIYDKAHVNILHYMNENGCITTKETTITLMKEYAQYHVEQALKEAAEKAELTDFAYEFLQEGAEDAIDKKSILKSYPLENIK